MGQSHFQTHLFTSKIWIWVQNYKFNLFLNEGISKKNLCTKWNFKSKIHIPFWPGDWPLNKRAISSVLTGCIFSQFEGTKLPFHGWCWISYNIYLCWYLFWTIFVSGFNSFRLCYAIPNCPPFSTGPCGTMLKLFGTIKFKEINVIKRGKIISSYNAHFGKLKVGRDQSQLSP